MLAEKSVADWGNFVTNFGDITIPKYNDNYKDSFSITIFVCFYL